MGIPRLISTLEPFAEHGVLDNDNVFIRPTSFLAILRLHGWTSSFAMVESIYFDGYLPNTKLPVRMERMVKSLNQLKASFSRDPNGFLPSYFSTTKETAPALFTSIQPPGKPFLPPSFHVPAIIDALRSCPRYTELVRLVPGEADAYCAQHVLKSGATVLTSDSDLLAHNLGNGRVSFFRDVYLDGQARLRCASFSPAQICEKLKLSSSAEISRLAYERKRSPHLSLPQILRDCAQPVADTTGYAEFCREYLDHESASIPISGQGSAIDIGSLDPRISELIIQLGHPVGQENETAENKIFLPILLESPSRGSAWEQSTSIRQLAYTIARWIIPGQESSIQEYRRVNGIIQKGRHVPMLTKEEAVSRAKDLVLSMSMVSAEVQGDADRSWQILCLTLNIRHCYEDGKHSHLLQILEESLQKPTMKRVSWDVLHFAAQLQAAYYSLRILKQVLSLAPIIESIPGLYDMLSSLPPLARFPDIERTLGFLRNSGEARSLRMVAKLVPLPNLDVETEPTSALARKKRKMGKGIEKAGVAKPPPRNPFDVLSRNA
ncbi:hypothetical protein FDECE_463 [Fusarium decemcellulare]|nr:hypothetical protein FDECE_463 [Fusarium decemcellulare]